MVLLLRLAQWFGLLITALLIALCIVTMFVEFGWQEGDRIFMLHSGAFTAAIDETFPVDINGIYRLPESERKIILWPTISTDTYFDRPPQTALWVTTPLWPIVVATGFPTVCLCGLSITRRTRAGHGPARRRSAGLR